MEFLSKYELLELVSERDGKTYSARQLASGQVVQVHRFDGVLVQAELMKLILAYLRTVSPDRPSQIVDMDQQEGSLYLATDPLPEGHSFRVWIESETWKRENLPSKPATPRPIMAVQPPALTMQGPDEVTGTRVLKAKPLLDRPRSVPSAPVPSSLTPSAPSAAPPSSPGGPPPPDREPGEFTRMFLRDSVAPAASTPPAKSQPTPAAEPRPGSSDISPSSQELSPASGPPSGSTDEPGDFTMIFRARDKIAAPIPPGQQDQQSPPRGVGESTSPFSRSIRSQANAPTGSEAGVESGPTTSGSSEPGPAPEPGEFTRIFQASALTLPTRPAEASPPPATTEAPPVPHEPPGPRESTGPQSQFSETVQFTSPRVIGDPRSPQAENASRTTPPAETECTNPSIETGPNIRREITAPAEPDPGEFTLIFRGSPAAPSPTGPTAEPPTEPSPPASPPNAPSRPQPEAFPGPREGTISFRAAPTIPIVASPTPTRPSPPAADRAGPGEFTQIFRGAPSTTPRPIGSSEPTRPVCLSASQPGEFTQIFRGAPSPTPSSERANPIAETAQPGEFTQIFRGGGGTRQSPEPYRPAAPGPASGPTVPQTPPGPAGQSDEPGEFTRIFRSPGFSADRPEPGRAQTPPAYPAPSQPGAPQPGDPRYGASFGGPSGPQRNQEGEFTRIFGSSSGAHPPSRPQAPYNSPVSPSGGSATQFNLRPPANATPQRPEAPPVPYGFSTPAAPGGQPPHAARPAMPTAPPVPLAALPVPGRPSMPATPAVPAPQVPPAIPAAAPPMPVPPTPGVKAGPSMLPLFVILGSLLVAAIFLTLYFVLRHPH